MTVSDTFSAAVETAPKPETEMQTVECLFTGRRVLRDGKLGEGYMTVEQADAIPASEWDRFEAAVSLFAEGKRIKGNARSLGVVGGVYKMEVKLTDGKVTTAKTGSKEYVRRYEKHDVVVACEVKDDAAKMHQRSAAMMTKLRSDSVLAGELDGLRSLYTRTPYADRLALELLVLESMRRGTL